MKTADTIYRFNYFRGIKAMNKKAEWIPRLI
jgi:hypothetical protein